MLSILNSLLMDALISAPYLSGGSANGGPVFGNFITVTITGAGTFTYTICKAPSPIRSFFYVHRMIQPAFSSDDRAFPCVDLAQSTDSSSKLTYIIRVGGTNYQSGSSRYMHYTGYYDIVDKDTLKFYAYISTWSGDVSKQTIIVGAFLVT